jgi:serine/threonine-protein kinase
VPDLKEWAESLIGQIVADKYELTGLLGIGGAGGVFLAKHAVLETPFALKLIVPNMHAGDLDEQEKRFMREAAMSLTLVHPRIVQVREFGLDKKSELLYMAMDYVKGRSLAQALRRAAQVRQEGTPLFSFARALAIVRGILDALTAAHAAGVIHRDLKPGNVLLVGAGDDEDVKLLDFGFAKALAPEGDEGEAKLDEQPGKSDT